MRIAGIIPARFASLRFSGKALALIEGKTLIRHVYEKALSSRCLHELVVATDDLRIVQEVESFGGKAVLTSPEHRCGTERVAEVAQGIEAAIIINIQGDELLSNAEMLDECVSALLHDSSLQAATLASEIKDESQLSDPHVVKVVTDINSNALLFSRSAIPSVHCSVDSSVHVRFLKHIGIYAFRRGFLLQFVKLEQTPLELAESLEQLRILEYGKRLAVVLTKYSSVGVDVPSDIDRAVSFLMSLERAEM